MKMQLLAFVLLAITIVAAGTEDDANQKRCEPGTRFRTGCTECICAKDGTSQVCTFGVCPQSVPEVRNRRQSTEKICEPGQTKQQDCNSCFCLADGSGWGCTLMACSPKICEPGREYKKYCNTCACAADGSSEACTRMECPKGVYNEDGSRKNPAQL